MRDLRRLSFAILAWLFLAGAIVVSAQPIPKEDYITYLPLTYPRIKIQTPASRDLHLFGNVSDPSYRDENPVDGIDDRRLEILKNIAVRFAPYMIQNTSDIPMDFKLFMADKKSFSLFIDTWDLSPQRPELIREQSINMVEVGKPCPPENLAPHLRDESTVPLLDTDDCLLLSLIQEFFPPDPSNPRFHNNLEDPYNKPFKVIYFDFPGHDEKTWKAAYESVFTLALQRQYQSFAKSYVHPFIYEDPARKAEESRYELALQYWLFYPTNDGGNNHEGDWEHINVIVSPLAQVGRMSTAEEIGLILNGHGLNEGDGEAQLVIKRVEYYFHHYVMLLDYSHPNVYLPRMEWRAQLDAVMKEKFGEEMIWKFIRYLAYWDDRETRINTHPIGYIGADNKGLDQILTMPGGKNRDSHGTYPFAGLYKAIGPAGASERISTFIDHRKYMKNPSYRKKIDAKKFGRGGFVEFNLPERLEIVPDWERVIDLVQEVPQARRGWSWLVLPMRWGYPATVSPFAGVISYADTGNASPVGPAYNSAWNRLGPGQGYDLYDPHRFPWLFPLDWVDTLGNSLGFLNLVIPTIGNIPPFDLAWRVIVSPLMGIIGERYPTFYTEDKIPFRFVGIAPGVAVQRIPDDFIILYSTAPETIDEIVLRILELDPDIINVQTKTTLTIETAVSAAFQIDLFLGKRLVSSNAINHSRSVLNYDLFLTNRPEPFNLRSELNLWEYAGSLRYNLSTGGFQPFVKGGWGLSWYRLEDIRTDGIPVSNPETPWIRKPSFSRLKSLLPNTWNYGAGLELLFIKSHSDFPKGIDVAARVEYTGYYHPIGINADVDIFGITTRKFDFKVTRHEAKFALSVSF